MFSNFFSLADLEYLTTCAEVIEARSLVDTRGKVSFKTKLTDSLRTSLEERLRLNLADVSDIPMRWIKGDTEPHIDAGSRKFNSRHLVYLTDCSGAFFIGAESYPIVANSGFVFDEGISHKTVGTGSEPRLLLGPMNEFAEPVGSLPILYYDNYADAAAQNANFIASQDEPSFVIGTGNLSYGSLGSYTRWRIAYISGDPPPSIPGGVYNNGFDLLSLELAAYTFYLYPEVPCFLEGTRILCSVSGVERHLPIEELKPGVLVKTASGAYIKVAFVGKGTIQNPGSNERIENRLYKLTPEKYAQLKSDLFITGCHAILVKTLTELQREETLKHLGDIYITDNHYRLIACVDERAEPWASEGVYTIMHFALEHNDPQMNYGVYANGGLLVETCSINFLKNRSNMTVI
jgi:hypothetical protein